MVCLSIRWFLILLTVASFHSSGSCFIIWVSFCFQIFHIYFLETSDWQKVYGCQPSGGGWRPLGIPAGFQLTANSSPGENVWFGSWSPWHYTLLKPLPFLGSTSPGSSPQISRSFPIQIWQANCFILNVFWKEREKINYKVFLVCWKTYGTSTHNICVITHSASVQNIHFLFAPLYNTLIPGVDILEDAVHI